MSDPSLVRNRIVSLIREPALLIDLVETIVLLVVTLGLTLTVDQQTWIVAAFVAAIGLAKGLLTDPFAPSLVTDFGRAALMLGASFGLNLDPDSITLIVTALGTLTTLMMTNRVAPVPAVERAAERVSHPRVRGEAGAVGLYVPGIVVLVVTLILALLTFAGEMAIPNLVLVVLGIAGVVMVALSRGRL